MGLRYKIDVLDALKEKGYTSYNMTKKAAYEKLGFDKPVFNDTVIQKFRSGAGVSWDNLERLCDLLEVQPGDIIEWYKD